MTGKKIRDCRRAVERCKKYEECVGDQTSREKKQDRQFTCNITLKRVRATVVAMEK